MNSTDPMVQTDSELGPLLDRVRRVLGRFAALNAAARGLTAAGVIVALAAAVERIASVPDVAAMALALVATAGAVVAALVFAWPLRRRPDDRRVARFVEERYPACADAIVTAVDIRDRGTAGRDFAPLVMASAVRTLSALELGAAVDPRGMRRAAARAGAAATLCVLAIVFARPLLLRGVEVAGVHIFPAWVTVRVASGDLRVAAGRPATILASVSGRTGALGHLTAYITLDAGGQMVTVPMARTADGYRFEVPSVDRSFRYIVTAGPAASRAYSVTALHPARVQRIDLQYDFPSFTGLKPRQEHDAGDVFGPAGTRVRVVVHADKPVREGALAFSQGQPAEPLTRVDDRTFATSLTIAEERAYRVGLVDPDGLTSESVEYFVRVMDDRPPDIHILRPGGDDPITPLQEVPIEARADDDFGVQKMDLVYSIGGGPERIVPFTAISGTDVARIGNRLLAAEDLKVKPGDVIAYYARAWDVPHAKPSSMTRSEIFFLEVKPFNEEYSVAQSQAGMQAATDTQLEGLISAQKEIISATWNLERRSVAGRSARDVKGVADAQVELKSRAERAAAQQQPAAPPRRRFGGGPQAAFGGATQVSAPVSQAPPDPVVKAVDAMGRAAQELQVQKTGSAIPHEMAALNALLEAQAENRRKQVTQQQQSSGGGAFGNRQTQDLSSLFDRELKRQQKTNYENKPEADTPPDAAKTESALDKIRDLARRQEELNRQQREIAKRTLSAEEMKRQLETLSREQEQLRKQAEEAAKGIEQGSQGSSGSRGSSGSQSARQEMNDALQQMRDAAAQGKKDDASGAASKGEQAADALRRVESRLQTASPDAQRRALGDLQLESQQVAQTQRQIAGEADRLDREGGGTGDARRRLANEKDRLADRVDTLQQAAQRLPAGAEAARELASQQLANRMRSTAQQLRDGQAAGKTAHAEQQIADALDSVVRKMGAADAGGAKGGTKAETGQLAGDLDAVRDARDRVARLEKEMRDLQQNQASRGQGGQSTGPAAAKGSDGGPGQPRGSQMGSKTGGQGGGAGSSDVARLQQQLDQERQRTRDLLDRLQRGIPQSGGNMATPEQHEWSRSAPGTEAFKQDYAAWQSLAADVAQALERAESSAASRLSAALARDRLRAGGSERVPDAYRRQVSKYFESIAVKKQP